MIWSGGATASPLKVVPQRLTEHEAPQPVRPAVVPLDPDRLVLTMTLQGGGPIFAPVVARTYTLDLAIVLAVLTVAAVIILVCVKVLRKSSPPPKSQRGRE